MTNIGDKLYKNKAEDIAKYTETAIWCNSNNAVIEDKGEYYEVVKIPKPSNEELNKQQAEIQKSELREFAITAMMGSLANNDMSVMQTEYNNKLESISDEVAVYIPEVYPQWNPNGVEYKEGKRICYNNVLYGVIQNHTSQANWKPDETASVYAKILTSPDGEILEWEQPLPTNAYQLGDRVKHNGRYYESTYDGDNVWEPGVVGEEFWKDITDEIQGN